MTSYARSSAGGRQGRSSAGAGARLPQDRPGLPQGRTGLPRGRAGLLQGRPFPRAWTDHAKIGTHRLWISMWKDLGRPGDNYPEIGDKREVATERLGGFHTPSPAGRAARTSVVDAECLSHQRERALSPESTAPMTATTFCSSERTTSSVTHRGSPAARHPVGPGRATCSRQGDTRRADLLKPPAATGCAAPRTGGTFR